MKLLCKHLIKTERGRDDWFSELFDDTDVTNLPTINVAPGAGRPKFYDLGEFTQHAFFRAEDSYIGQCHRYIYKGGNSAAVGTLKNSSMDSPKVHQYEITGSVIDLGDVKLILRFYPNDNYAVGKPNDYYCVGELISPFSTDYKTHRVFGYNGTRSNFHSAIPFVFGHVDWCEYQFWDDFEDGLLNLRDIHVVHYEADTICPDVPFWEGETKYMVENGHHLNDAFCELYKDLLKIYSELCSSSPYLIDKDGLVDIPDGDKTDVLMKLYTKFHSIPSAYPLTEWYNLTEFFRRFHIAAINSGEINLSLTNINLYHQSNNVTASLLNTVEFSYVY